MQSTSESAAHAAHGITYTQRVTSVGMNYVSYVFLSLRSLIKTFSLTCTKSIAHKFNCKVRREKRWKIPKAEVKVSMGFNYEPNKKAATATLKLLPSALKALKMSERERQESRKREESSRRSSPCGKLCKRLSMSVVKKKKNSAAESKTEC